MSAVTAPAVAAVGQTIDVSWTVTNVGADRTGAVWTDCIYVSKDESHGYGDVLAAEEAVGSLLPLAAGDSYTITRQITIPDFAPGDRYLLFRADGSNDQGEVSEANNLLAVPIRLVMADLELSDVTSPASAEVGEMIEVSWTVKNVGTGMTGLSWSDCVYVSQDATLDTEDALAFSAWVGDRLPLASGGQYTVTAQLAVPDVPAGSYFMLFQADGTQDQPETSEANNVVAVPITLTTPDLQVSDVSVPELAIGNPAYFDVSWTVTNVGTAPVRGDGWVDQVVLTTSPTGHFGTIVAEVSRAGLLDVGQSYAHTQRIRAPIHDDNVYRVIVHTDVNDAVYEGESEANNYAEAANRVGVAAEPFADMAITEVVAPAAADSGELISVTWTVINHGIAPTRRSRWEDELLVTRDAAGSTSASWLGTFAHIGTLGVGQSYTHTADFRLPPELDGTYYISVSTPNASHELYSDDNRGVSGPVEVTYSPPPDLAVTDIVAPAEAMAGDWIDVTWTVSNEGDGIARGSWLDTIYMTSIDGEHRYLLSPLFQFAYSDGLGAGLSYTRSERVRLPGGVSGEFRVEVTTDRSGRMYEAGQTDNNMLLDDTILSIHLPDRPDLQVESITAPSQVTAGQAISLEYVVANFGVRGTDTPHWQDSVLLSTDDQFSYDDIRLESFDNTAALAPGESYLTQCVGIEIPKRARGLMYLIVVADRFKDVEESPNEDNNWLAVPLEVEPLPPADLVTSDVVAPDQTLTGQTISVRYTVTNLGAGETVFDGTRQTWTDTVWLTSDRNRPYPGFGPRHDILLGSFSHSGTFAVGDSYERVVSVTMPDIRHLNFEPGQWFITPWIDTYDLVREETFDANVNPDDPNELDNNNYKARPILVIAKEPDLAVTSLVAPDQVFAGEPFTVHATIENRGTEPVLLKDEWINRCYLTESPRRDALRSMHLAWTGEDRSLQPDESVTVEFVTRSPQPDDRGNYVWIWTDAGMIVDNTFHSYDPNPDNNWLGRPIEVIRRPADLMPTSVVSTSGVFSGGAIEVEWTVQNVGHTVWPGTPLWSDQVWLSTDPELTLSQSGALVGGWTERLGAVKHINRPTLAAGDSYTATVTNVTAPRGLTGPYYMFVFTDYFTRHRPNGYVYEGPNEENNVTVSSSILFELPPPSDLQAHDILLPDAALCGDEIHVAWTITNFGNHPAQGQWTDAVYLSGDATWDLHDPLVGRVPHYGDLGVGEAYGGELTALLPPIASGQYRVIVRPDIHDQVWEDVGEAERGPTIVGPMGYDADGMLPVETPLPYTINFENDAVASTAANEVRILVPLDDELLPGSFRLGDLRLGDIQVHIPAGRGGFEGDFDFSQSKGFILRVNAGVDMESGTATWLLQAIDPETGELLTDPDVGLLPPNDANGIGAGFVSYTVLPRRSVTTGTEVSAQGRVSFDTAPAMDTNTVIHAIDAAAPITTLTAEPLSPGSDDYLVQWQAVDDDGGSGLRHVTVYVAEDGGVFRVWQRQSTEIFAIFDGEPGHTYEFLALATDNAGNREEPGFGVTVPGDDASVNLGALPSVGETTPTDVMPPGEPEPGYTSNPLFAHVELGIPGPVPVTRPPEYTNVMRPFAARAFAAGIPQSHADIGPMGIVERPDGSFLASGGANRGQLYRVAIDGGQVDLPLASLPYPVFALTLDSQGRLWATTGGGPLLQLDSNSGEILGEYADRLTQALAIEPATDRIFVASGDGVEIFDPATETFAHFSDVRVGSLAFDPRGRLWGCSWPDRGGIVRCDGHGQAEQMLHFDTPVDSLAFGQVGTELENLLFVTHNVGLGEAASELTMVDLATLAHAPVAVGGSRGDVVITTGDGRVLVSQSYQIDVFKPVIPPEILYTNPPDDTTVFLPRGTVAVTYDQDMLVTSAAHAGSVLNPANYELTTADGQVRPEAVVYDTALRTALLTFEAFAPGEHELTVQTTVCSAAGAEMNEPYVWQFLAVLDFSAYVDIQIVRARSHRADETVSYEVTITNIGERDLILPVLLVLDPAAYFHGRPLEASFDDEEGVWLIDLADSLPEDGRLPAGESTSGVTVTVAPELGQRILMKHGFFTLPYPNAAPVFDSWPVTVAAVGEVYDYQAQAHDPDGAELDVAPHAPLLGLGDECRISVVGDFADQAGVILPPSYVAFASTDPSVAAVSDSGKLVALTEGTSVVLASSHGLQASTLVVVAEPDEDGDYSIDLSGLEVYPSAVSLPAHGGTRELLVTMMGDGDVSAAAAGTRYFASNPQVIDVSENGVILAKDRGLATVTVVHEYQEAVVTVRVGEPQAGPAVIGGDGGVVLASDGSHVQIAPAALDEATTVVVDVVEPSELPAPTPDGLVYQAAFHIDVGADPLAEPMQMAVRVSPDVPPGTRLFVYRADQIPDASRVMRDAWFQLDVAVVGADGFARTTSPPYPGLFSTGYYYYAMPTAADKAVLAMLDFGATKQEGFEFLYQAGLSYYIAAHSYFALIGRAWTGSPVALDLPEGFTSVEFIQVPPVG